MATKESMMNFISGASKKSDYVPYVAEESAATDTAPQLEILACPLAVNKKLVVISGTLKDEESREPHLFLNQKEVTVRGGKWVASVPVNEGINHVIVSAVNNTGKNVFTSRDIFCGLLPPRLVVDDVPELTSRPAMTISGTVSDINPGSLQIPEVSVNDKVVEVGENGKWGCAVKTKDGENVFVITAKNGSKSPTVIRKVIIKAPGLPEFCLDGFSELSPVSIPVISGTLKSAAGGRPCHLRINDQDVSISQDGRFSTKVKLKHSSENTVTFTVIAERTYTLQKQITYDPPPPTNTVLKCEPAQKRILYRISGVASDETGAVSAVSVNGKDVGINKGAWNTVLTVKFGFTPVVIVTKNNFGKTSVLLGSIYLEAIPPEITISNCPETVKAAEVTLGGTIKDPDGEMLPVIFVNSEIATIKGEEWNATIPLVPGSVNSVKITAKSDTGKSTEIVANIDCTLIVPSLKVLNCPRETSNPELILRGFARSGYVEDQNNVKVFVNNAQIGFADGKWTHSVTLRKGENIFVIASENKDGERVEEKKTVVLL